jgi:uncharacterized protein YbbC (DUF1343 family)
MTLTGTVWLSALRMASRMNSCRLKTVTAMVNWTAGQFAKFYVKIVLAVRGEVLVECGKSFYERKSGTDGGDD